MITIQKYIRAKSLEEAYQLCQKKGSVVLGGMLWLKQQNRRVSTAVDLCGLGLDKIEEVPHKDNSHCADGHKYAQQPGLHSLAEHNH